MIEHDQNYYVKLSRAVCGNVAAIHPEDPLLEDLRILNLNFQERLNQTNLSHAISELANDSVQNFNEHISRNLGAIFCRVFTSEMTRNENFNETPEIIRKLAIHIWKLLANCKTYWPRSVPVTHERTNECHRIITAYFPWFLFLLDLEDVLDGDYRPPANINEPDEEFEDDLDEDFEDDLDDGMDVDVPRDLPRFRPRPLAAEPLAAEPLAAEPLAAEPLAEPLPLINVDDENLPLPLNNPWNNHRTLATPSIYPDQIKRNPKYFVYLMFRGLRRMEQFQTPNMSSIVPQRTLMRRHIPISRDDFHCLLRQSEFENVPALLEFRNNDDLAARWYWSVFNFARMKIHRFVDFRARMKCFDFKLYSDGYAFSVQFTRPRYPDSIPLLPQNIVPEDGDVTFFVDPGKTDCFTAMRGLSFNPDQPAPLIKLSRREYNQMAGIPQARERFLSFKPDEAQQIESRIPSKRTMNFNSYLQYVEYIGRNYRTLTSCYDIRFNKLKFQTHVGSQKALSEVIRLDIF